MSLLELVDQLEQMADRAMHVPASGRVLVDEAALRRLIDEIRQAVPDEAQMNRRVAAERDKMLAEARTQARRMLEEAQAQVNSRLEDQNAVQLARERARAIIADAEQQAARLRADANSYVANQLNALESRLQRVLHEVQSGQRYLTQPGDKQGAEPGKQP